MHHKRLDFVIGELGIFSSDLFFHLFSHFVELVRRRRFLFRESKVVVERLAFVCGVGVAFDFA
jgi:hypothetical protein